jgi:uncharacterized protein
VLNVVDFGAFVDIGMHDSGLVHISQLSPRYVRDPHDVVSVGEVVRVWVLELDKARRRVALTMLTPDERHRQQQIAEQRKEGRGRLPDRGGRQQPAGERPREALPPRAGDRPPPARPPRRRGKQHAAKPREPQPRVYEAKPKKEAKPLTKAMQEGREPLRTFGELAQFLRSSEPPPEPSPSEPPSQDSAQG